MTPVTIFHMSQVMVYCINNMSIPFSIVCSNQAIHELFHNYVCLWSAHESRTMITLLKQLQIHME